MVKTELVPEIRPEQRGGPPAFARYAWGVLAYNVAVVLWGAYVRATGSGAGCGNHWPLCNGEVVPQLASVQRLIEFSHRASSGVDTFLILALVVWAFRIFPKGHVARLGSVLTTTFLVTEALLGALLVKFGLVENNASPARAFADGAHLVNTLTLLACITLTAWWGSGRPRFRVEGRAGLMAAISLGAVVLLGITGVIAALGDTLFPATSLQAGLAQDLDTTADALLRLRLWHPMIAGATAAWLSFYSLTSASRKLAWTVGGLLAMQLAAGILNIVLLAPVWMQMVHLMLADALWISLVLLCATNLAQPGPGGYKDARA
jgi:heme A synthase